MTAYGPPAGPPAPARPAASPEQRANLLGYVAGVLGVLSFVWGFLTWFTEGSGDHAPTATGYSIQGAGATAVIGVSLAAGLLAAVRSYEKKDAALVPVALGVTALLLVIGVVIGKGGIDDGSGNSIDVGMGIGLILELITVILQVGALVVAWLMATGKMPTPRPHAPAQPQYPGYQPQQGYPQQPPQGYGPPPGYTQQGAATHDQPQYQPPQPQQQQPQQQPQQGPQQGPQYPYRPPQQ